MKLACIILFNVADGEPPPLRMPAKPKTAHSETQNAHKQPSKRQF